MFVKYDGIFSIISSTEKRISVLIILAIIDKINQNAKQLRTYEAVYVDDSDGSEDEDLEQSVAQQTEQKTVSAKTVS